MLETGEKKKPLSNREEQPKKSSQGGEHCVKPQRLTDIIQTYKKEKTFQAAEKA